MKKSGTLENIIRKAGMLTLTAFIAGAVGCAGNLKTAPPKNETVIYPSDEGKPEVMFIQKYSSSEDIVKKDVLSDFFLGKEDTTRIKRPWGVEMSKGKLYVSDPGLGIVHLFDLKNNEYTSIGKSGGGGLRMPFGMHISEDGTLYVADAARKFVYEYDKDNRFIGTIGPFNHPVDVDVQDGRVYVCDIRESEIEVWGKEGGEKYKKLFAIKDEKMGFPTSIAIEDDFLYVGNSGTYNIQKYDLEGKLIQSLGKAGDRPGNFARIKGIAAGNGLVGVSDYAIQKIQLFSDEFDLLTVFAEPGACEGCLEMPAGIFITSRKENLDMFRKYVPESYNLTHIIGVTSQFGPNKVNIYAVSEKKE